MFGKTNQGLSEKRQKLLNVMLRLFSRAIIFRQEIPIALKNFEKQILTRTGYKY